MPTNPYGDDPNLDSQAPASGQGDQSDPGTQAAMTQKVNDVVRRDPVIAQWLTAHNNGVGLSSVDTAALKALVSQRTRGQIQDFAVDAQGNLQDVKAPDTFWKTLAIGSAAVVAPLLIGSAIAGLGGAAAAGADTAAVAPLASTALPATGALATGTVASGAVPAALAAGGAASGGAALPAVAGAAGTVASKGISSWLAPVLQGVVPTVGSLVGATIAANASKDASAANAESIKEALDFEKQQYADLTGRLAPYISAGTASSDRMSQLLGLPARTGTTATAAPSRGPSVNPYAGPTPSAPAAPTPASGQMVTLQAPDGTTKQVPAEQAAHYQSLGAKIVQAAA